MSQWIDIRGDLLSAHWPKPEDYPIWVCDKDSKVWLFATFKYMTKEDTHWKKCEPHEIPAPPTQRVDRERDGAIAAWRKLNPGYGPDEGPSDEFFAAFKAGMEWYVNENPPF